MTRALTTSKPVSLAEFDAVFESVKNWGRWGPDDELGTLNLVTPEKTREALGLVRSGRTLSLSRPIAVVSVGGDRPPASLETLTIPRDGGAGSVIDTRHSSSSIGCRRSNSGPGSGR